MSKVRLPSAVWPLISLCSVYLLWNWLQSAFFVIEPQAHERNLQIFSQKATIVPSEPVPLDRVAGTVTADTPQSNDTTAVADSCVEEKIRVRAGAVNDEIVLCVVSRQVIQDGEARTYQYRAGDKAAWSLDVRVRGLIIESAELRNAKNALYRCENESCQGVTITKRDSMGRRHVKIDATLPSSETGTDEPVQVSADLTTKPDRDVSGLACTGPSVTITGNDNSSIEFCPLGGIGFSSNEEGTDMVYSFRNFEGEAITVSVDATYSVRKVGFDDDRLSCVAEQCAGAAISELNEKGERTFNFFGVTLRNESNSESLLLNGTFVLPPIS